MTGKQLKKLAINNGWSRPDRPGSQLRVAENILKPCDCRNPCQHASIAIYQNGKAALFDPEIQRWSDQVGSLHAVAFIRKHRRLA